MKTVEFVSIRVENFKSYLGKHTLHIDEYERGVHLVKAKNMLQPRLGSNGAGKSTLWADAPDWCLYGKTAGGLRGTDVRPWGKVKGATCVTMRVIVDGKERKITRSLNPSLLLIDGKDASQESVERLIGMSQVTFNNTVLLGQGRPLFFDLKPRDKMALFVDALSLGKWDDRSKAAAARVQDLNLAISEIEGEITGLRQSLESLESYIKSEQAKQAEWDAGRQKALKDAKAVHEELLKIHEVAQRKRDDADLKLEEAETERRHYERKVPKAEAAALKAHKALQAEHLRVDQARDALAKARKELEEIGEGDKCKTCGQSLRGTNLAKHQATLRRQAKDLKKVVADGVRSSIAQEAEKADVQMRHVRQMQRKFTDAAIEARDALESKDRLWAEAQAQIKEAEALITRTDEEANPHRDTVVTLRKKIRQAERRIEDAKEELAATQLKMTRAKFWVKGFKDIRLYVTEEVLQELELEINSMLDDAGLVDWLVHLSLEREGAKGSVFGLNVMIESPQSEGRVKWESWSGGEAQRLRIVSALALKEVLLNRAGVEPKLEVIDEPTRGLSPEGVEDLLAYLQDRAIRLDLPVFLIDHAARESARFASTTTVLRDAGGSRLKGG